MAIYRRGKWWWTHFYLNGERYRVPLRTKDWREAQAREKEMIGQASQESSLSWGSFAFPHLGIHIR